jgi:hypothetical protein
MSRSAQILQIDPPNELTFKGPFSAEVVTSQLTLTNPSAQSVCFKVKTTAPKRYCVRPNSGVIPSKQSVNVAVMLQPFDSTTASLEQSSRHKFMVQSCVSPDDSLPLDSIWKSVPAEQFMDSKLRVVFQEGVAEGKGDQTQSTAAEWHGVVADQSTLLLHSALSSPKSSNVEAELRKAIDERKRATADYDRLEKEYSALKERMSKMSASVGASDMKTGSVQLRDTGEQGYPLWVLLLVAVMALLFGAIAAKLV